MFATTKWFYMDWNLTTANDPSLTRKIGFISHMDTADFNAEGVNPQVIENYDGGVIELGEFWFPN